MESRIDEIIKQLEKAKEMHSVEVDLAIASNMLDALIIDLER
jgi:hypothetical protein